MKKVILIAAMVCALMMALASPAFAHRWGDYDVSNNGQSAKVDNNLDRATFKSTWSDVRQQLNNLAGTRGVYYNNQGTAGEAGVDWEVKLRDVNLAPGIGGRDLNYVNCDSRGCLSHSIVEIANSAASAPERNQKRIFRHEFAHSLSAPHEKCFMRDRSIMVGNPPCANPFPILLWNFGPHDLDNYAYNRKRGVYDDTLNANAGPPYLGGTVMNDGTYVTKSTVVEWAKSQGSDKLRIKRHDGEVQVEMVWSDARHKTH